MWLVLHQVLVVDLKEVSTGCLEQDAGISTFTKDSLIGRHPLLIDGEETKGITRKITHKKQRIYSVNTRCHESGMFVGVF